jgi:hypothetical protein
MTDEMISALAAWPAPSKYYSSAELKFCLGFLALSLFGVLGRPATPLGYATEVNRIRPCWLSSCGGKLLGISPPVRPPENVGFCARTPHGTMWGYFLLVGRIILREQWSPDFVLFSALTAKNTKIMGNRERRDSNSMTAQRRRATSFLANSAFSLG